MRQNRQERAGYIPHGYSRTCRASMPVKCWKMLRLNEDDRQGHHTHSRHERLENIGHGRTGRHKACQLLAVHEKRDAVCFHGGGE